MNAGEPRFPFDAWWTSVLAKDAVYIRAWQRDRNDDTGLPEENPFLSCVFCGRSLEQEIRHEASGPFRGGHMLAYWMANEDHSQPDSPIVAAGMYCHGSTSPACLADARRVGFLLDDHAPHATGRSAWPHMQRRVFDYHSWKPLALRRFVLIYTELARLPTLKRER
jgi:hypothetical protein